MMSLHPLKTSYTVFHSNGLSIPWNDIKLYIDENDPNTGTYIPLLRKEISQVNPESNVPAIKFLGVYFDPYLSFKFQINQLSIQLSKALYILTSLYYSIFHSHLIYGMMIYTSACQSFLSCIRIKQKKAIRCITGSNYNEHTPRLFKELKILPFDLLIKYQNLQFMSDYVNSRLPKSFYHIWQTHGERNVRYNLRNAQDYDIPFFRTELVHRLPLCKIPKTWNDLAIQTGLKGSISKPLFKTKLKNYLLTSIDTNCYRPQCNVCNMHL